MRYAVYWIGRLTSVTALAGVSSSLASAWATAGAAPARGGPRAASSARTSRTNRDRLVADAGLIGVWVVGSPRGWNIGLRPLGPFQGPSFVSGKNSPKSGFLPDSCCSSVMYVTLGLWHLTLTADQ